MTNPVMLENDKNIDTNYFDNYGGASYSENYLAYTTSSEEIISTLKAINLSFQTILDIGCASGELVRDLREHGYLAYGIENNKEILKKSIIPKYCVLMDMTKMSSIKDNSFDIIYTNAMMYLKPNEVGQVLKEMHRITKKGVYFCNPYLEKTNYFNDPYRKFLATKQWWIFQFLKSGFIKTDSPYVFKKF